MQFDKTKMQLDKEFFRKFKEEFGQYGFRKKGKTYMRVVDEVLQVLSFIKSKNNTQIRLTFESIPLCSKISHLTEGIYHTTNDDSTQGWIDYNRILNEGENQIVNELMDSVRNVIIPYFEKTTTCCGALDENIKMEYALNEKRREIGASFLPYTINGKIMIGLHINYYDSNKLYMALKCNEVDIAMTICHLLRSNSLFAIRPENEKKFSSDVWKKRVKSVEQNVAEMDAILNSLVDGDKEFINKILAENEAASLLTLEKI